jgi:hypothetical protein
MKSSMRARSYAALTINSGSRPDSPLAHDGNGNGPSFLLSPPPPFPIIASRSANGGARRAAAATVAIVTLVLLATIGLLALALGGGGGGGGSRGDGAGSLSTPRGAFPWPPQLEADNAAAGKRGAAVDPSQPPAPLHGRRLKLVLVVHRHGARTPLVFAYGGTGNGTDSQQDAKIPYSRCLREYPGVGLAFRALAATTTTTSSADDDPILPPGENVDELEPVMPGDGSCRLGTLTRRGYAQALRLGLWLRARYCGDDGAAAAAASQKRLACSAPNPTWQLYSSRLRRTVATLRGVLTGLVADEEVTRGLLRALDEEGEEARSGDSTALATTAPLPTFTVSQCATHGAEFMYGKSTSCPALAPLVKAAERDALKTDAREPEALAAAKRACKEVLGDKEGGCASPEAAADDPPVDWRRLRDVVTAMLAEHGPRGGLELLPLPQKAGTDKADDGGADAAQPNKALLRSLGETMAYAARREARIIAPADPRDRTIALGVGPLVERIRAAVAESADGADSNDEPRFAIYSGHDSTMMPLLTVLGAAEENAAWPPYASSLVFEVWGPAAGGAKGAGVALEGRRERAGAGRPPPPHHRPSADDDEALVRVLHDGRLFQERAASELVEALGAWAVDDEARAGECRGGGGGGDGGAAG